MDEEEAPTTGGSLESFPICKTTKKHLRALGFNHLLPVQVLSFKHVYEGRDVVCKARTGFRGSMGSKAPVFEYVGMLGFRGSKIVVVLPTRELAQQVHADFSRLSVGRYGAVCIYGGAPEGPQINLIRQGAHALVATPGRLLDFIERGIVTLEAVEAVVMDEADKLLEMGFREDIEKLLRLLQQQKAAQAPAPAAPAGAAGAADRGDYQLLLFTATFPRWAKSISEVFMRKEKKVFLDASSLHPQTKEKEKEEIRGSGPMLIEHLALQCHWKGRIDALPLAISLYAARAAAADRQAAAAIAATTAATIPADRQASADHSQKQHQHQQHQNQNKNQEEEEEVAQCVVFCETKQEVNEVALNSSISSMASPLHGDIPQQQREATLTSFKKKRFRCLVATDVAARGLDISSVRLVVQMNPPRDVETYIHRAGRTGRAGRRGIALLFYGKGDADFLAQIEREGGFLFKRVGFPQPSIVRTHRLISMASRLFPGLTLKWISTSSSLPYHNRSKETAGKEEEVDLEEVILHRIAKKLLKKQEPQDVVIELLRNVLQDRSLGRSPLKGEKVEGGGPNQGLSALTGRPGFVAYRVAFNPPPSPPLQRSCAYVWRALKNRCSSSSSASALIEKIEYMTLTADGCGAVFEVPEDKLEAWEREVVEAFFSKAPKLNTACNTACSNNNQNNRSRGGITLRKVAELPPLQDALFLARQELQQRLEEDPRGSSRQATAARFNPNHLSNRRGGAAAAAAGRGRSSNKSSSSSRSNGGRRGSVGFSKGAGKEESLPARLSVKPRGRGAAADTGRGGPAKRRRVA
ncbi:hypothetical protein ACSSS7_001766 [Eimeria intestinalis]